MEQFDHLESRVHALLEELQALKSREATLQEEVVVLRVVATKYTTLQQTHQELHRAVKTFEEEHTINDTLRRALEQERSVREAVEKRIDILLARIQQAVDSE